MDQRERNTDLSETLRLAFQSFQSRLWTALPGVIKQFPAASGLGSMIADIQPTINGRTLKLNSNDFQTLQMPVLLDCPILFQGGGGVTATFPIEAGDECLVIFASRCIDAWWQQGNKTSTDITKPNAAMNPPDLRMHNLSDGFALVGVRSLPRSYAVDSANAALITDDGQAYVKINPTTHVINVVAGGGITLNGASIDSAANVYTAGTLATATGASGTFTSLTGQTITVQNGIIVNID